MLKSEVAHLKAVVHQHMEGQPAWLNKGVSDLIDLFTGPLTGLRTRYYWLDIVESLIIVAIVYLWASKNWKGCSLRGFLRFCFPKEILTHPSSILDYKLNVTNFLFAGSVNVFWRLNTALMTAGLLAVLTRVFGQPTPILHWSLATLAIFTVLLAVMDDFGFYWFHYLAHKIPSLWAFHKLHHSAEVLTPLTASRVHPIELTITGVFKAAAMALLAAPTLYLFVGEASLVQLFGMNLALWFLGVIGNQLHHCHIWISFGPKIEHILVSPAQHQVHHSIAEQHWDRNFAANFAFWDWMFGTLYLTKPYEKITFGIIDDVPNVRGVQVHNGVFSAYLMPLWEMFPRAMRARLIAAYHQFRGHPRDSAAGTNTVDRVAKPVESSNPN